jgi:hypothetical protein
MRSPLALVIAVLVACLSALLISACSSESRDAAPSAGQVVHSSVLAVAAQQHVKVAYDVTATVRATAGASASAQTRAMLARPITVKLAGGASQQAVTAKLHASLAGRNYEAQARVGSHESYVNLLGSWYGDRRQGLDSGKAKAESSIPADPAELARQISQLRAGVDRVIDADVTAGPDIDGPTWQASGHLDAAAVAKLAARAGHKLSSSDAAALDVFARAADIRYAVGASDRLPRQLAVTVDLDARQIAALAGGHGSVAAEISAARVEVAVTLTRWGQDVDYRAPAEFQPMSEISGALLGLLMGAMAPAAG